MLNLNLVTNVVIAETVSMERAQRQIVKWLEHRVLVQHLQGRLWERCRNRKRAFVVSRAFQSYGDGAWDCLPVLKNRG